MGMTPRQTAFGAVGIVVIVSGYLLLPIPNVLAMLLGFPCFVVGFYRPEGINCEKYLWYWLESKLFSHRTRYFESENNAHAFLWKHEVNGRRVKGRKEHAKTGTE